MKNTEQTTKKRTLTGTIVSEKMDKTRVVLVTRMKKHPKYHKYHKVSQRFHAHDAENQYHVGDVVTVAEARPMSKLKRWTIIGKA